ncbi:MAG: hypothetical protein R3240_00080 [Gammaproteobacteria bacterium]|nr:hypothetical protein [Gammaproteobacteria bacterium]
MNSKIRTTVTFFDVVQTITPVVDAAMEEHGKLPNHAQMIKYCIKELQCLDRQLIEQHIVNWYRQSIEILAKDEELEETQEQDPAFAPARLECDGENQNKYAVGLNSDTGLRLFHGPFTHAHEALNVTPDKDELFMKIFEITPAGQVVSEIASWDAEGFAWVSTH